MAERHHGNTVRLVAFIVIVISLCGCGDKTNLPQMPVGKPTRDCTDLNAQQRAQLEREGFRCVYR